MVGWSSNKAIENASVLHGFPQNAINHHNFLGTCYLVQALILFVILACLLLLLCLLVCLFPCVCL